MFWVPYIFKIWIAILKGRDFLEFIASNGRIVLKCILVKYFLICGLHFFDTNGDQ